MPGPDCRRFTPCSKTNKRSHASVIRPKQATLLVVTYEDLTPTTVIGTASKNLAPRNVKGDLHSPKTGGLKKTCFYVIRTQGPEKH